MVWRKKKTKNANGPEKSGTDVEYVPKYAKPKIMLIDMPPACDRVLRDAGYNVSVGTFGTPRRVKRCDDLFWVSGSSASLPNCEEQEIIIANTSRPDPSDVQPGEGPGEGVEAFWEHGNRGVADPRPLAMHFVRSAFDKVQEHGGIFIVFVSERYEIKYLYGASSHGVIDERRELDLTNWWFLSDLWSFNVASARGTEISLEPRAKQLSELLARGSANAHYSCTMSPSYRHDEHWLPLARNKYGEHVGGLLVYGDPKRYLMVLPQMPEVDKIILELVEDWCANWKPALFPELMGARWVHRREYEIPRVNELVDEIERVEREAKERTETLDSKIREERERNKYWYALLNGTGNELVKAVIHVLEQLGFGKVIDVDKEAKEKGTDETLREDIQIHDLSPVLIVDVKGVSRHPNDDDCRQAEKHATMRMKEWDRTDVRPLTIINYQRHLPPHDRDRNPFRSEIIGYAEETQLGLMTTWDLFKLKRNADNLGWSPDVVKPIFHRTGHIDPVPAHYTGVGKVVRVWQMAFGIIPNQTITTSSRIAIEVGDLFEEIKVQSLQVADKDVEEAPPRSNCGIGYDEASARLRKGMRVFLVGHLA